MMTFYTKTNARARTHDPFPPSCQTFSRMRISSDVLETSSLRSLERSNCNSKLPNTKPDQVQFKFLLKEFHSNPLIGSLMDTPHSTPTTTITTLSFLAPAIGRAL